MTPDDDRGRKELHRRGLPKDDPEPLGHADVGDKEGAEQEREGDRPGAQVP